MGRSWSLRHRRELTMWVLLCCGVPKKALSLRHILARVEHRTLVSLPAVTSPEFILMALVRIWSVECGTWNFRSWAFILSDEAATSGGPFVTAAGQCLAPEPVQPASLFIEIEQQQRSSPPPLFFIFNPWSLMSLCQPSTLQQNLYVQGVGTSLWLGAVAKSDLLLDKPLDVLFGLFLPRKDLWCVLLVTSWQLFFFFNYINTHVLDKTTWFKLPSVMRFLKGLQHIFPLKHCVMPQWGLNQFNMFLVCTPFEPMNSCSLWLFTLEMVFLVVITSACRVSELQAL